MGKYKTGKASARMKAFLKGGGGGGLNRGNTVVTSNVAENTELKFMLIH